MKIYILELLIYITVITLFYRLGKLHNIFPSLAVTKKVFIIVFLYLLTVSQVFKNPSVTYPLTYWGMYSQVHPSTIYVEHIIKLDNGLVKHYPYDIITFTSQRAFMRRVENLEQSTRRTEERELLEQVLSSLIDIYEKQGENRVVEFKLNEVRISQSDSDDNFSHPRTNVFKISRN